MFNFHNQGYIHNILMLKITLHCVAGYFQGANFPELHEYAHNSGKFILCCCVNFNCGSLLQNLPWVQ